MNILFVSSSYIERTLFDYFINSVSEHNFILLKWNHPEIVGEKLHNLHFMDLDQALNISDYVYILTDGRIPTVTKKKCFDVARNRGICFSYNKLNDVINDSLSNYLYELLIPRIVNKPIILILQAGITAQIERMELEICHSLVTKGVKYKLYTNSWLSNLSTSFPIFKFKSQIEKSDLDEQISLISVEHNVIELLESRPENIFFDVFMRNLRPDYILMCCEHDYTHMDALNEIFKIRFSKGIDSFVHSEYISYLAGENAVSEIFVKTNKSHFVFNDIQNKMTFPKGIKEFCSIID